MSMTIQTNVRSLNSHRSLSLVSNRQSRASARLSSGFRINSGADDAAGLAISEGMRAQIRGLRQASRNIQDGISLLQTMEGGMAVISDKLQRMRELVVQAMNDTYNSMQRQFIQQEINQLILEVTDTSYKTKFNGIPLLIVPEEGILTAPTISVTLQPGENPTDQFWGFVYVPAGVTFDIFVQVFPPTGHPPGAPLPNNWPDLIIQAPNGDNFGFASQLSPGGSGNNFFTGGAAGTVTTSGAASSIMYTGINSIQSFPHIEAFRITNTSASGYWQVRMSNAGGVIPITFELSVGTAPGLAPISPPPLNLIPHGQGGFEENPLIIQAGPDAGDGMTLTLRRFDTRAAALGIASLDVSSHDLGGQSLVSIDNAIERVNVRRATVGALLNRFEFSIHNNDITAENLSASESRIRDADMALEMMALTQMNILQQAATVMLAQANQAPQNVLHILNSLI